MARTLVDLQIPDEAWRIGAARERLLGWGRYVDPGYAWPRHVRYMADTLERLERGEIDRLIIEIPPRHSKSETTTVKLPPWFLGRNPDARVIITAHTDRLASTFSRRVRNDFATFAPQVFGLDVADDSAAVDQWEIKGHRGGVVAAGVGGALVGHGGDLIIIDDPIKDAEAAHSLTQRNAIHEWYRSVLRTRLHPGGRIVLVTTRWHKDDLAGRLLEEATGGGERWTVIHLPALAEENDPLGRSPGDALWPERYSEAELLRITASVGPYVWAALYQQNPADEGGVKFRREWFIDRFIDELPSGLTLVRFWDLATSTTGGADYTVGAKVGIDGEANLYIAHIARGRWEWPDTRRIIIETALQDGPEVQVGVEKAGFQIAGWQDLMRDRRLISHTIVPVPVTKSKELRADPLVARASAKKVYIVRGPWNQDFLDELLAFPHGEHDDQIDAPSGAVQMLAASMIPEPEIF